MPVCDTKLKVVYGDPKPEKVCHWADCPNDGKYHGMKLKSCSRCTWIRYCCKSCQAADWPTHKAVCRVPKMIDIAAWIDQHEWFFKWAAIQALGRNNTNLTQTHALLVDLTRTDRLVRPTTLAFIVEKLHVAPLRLLVRRYSLRDPVFTDANHDESAQLQRQGGLGLAMVGFLIGGPNGTTLFRGQKVPLDGICSSETQTEEWAELVKRVVNREISPSAIPNCPITPPPSESVKALSETLSERRKIALSRRRRPLTQNKEPIFKGVPQP